MPGGKGHSWKILAIGRGSMIAETAEKHLHELGYQNAKVLAVDNDKASDDKFIELLKNNDWDGVSIGKSREFHIFELYINILSGGAINGFDDHLPKEVTTLHWFNRLVNLVHEHAPKAKLIFVTRPADMVDSFERVLGAIETPVETV
jgi:hypothetical protein